MYRQYRENPTGNSHKHKYLYADWVNETFYLTLLQLQKLIIAGQCDE